MTSGRQGELTREIALNLGQAALLIIDVQNDVCRRDSAAYAGLSDEDFERRHRELFTQLNDHALPNLQRLQSAFRQASAEGLYSKIECLTIDGRERSLDYKIRGSISQKDLGAEKLSTN